MSNMSFHTSWPSPPGSSTNTPDRSGLRNKSKKFFYESRASPGELTVFYVLT